MSDNWSCGNFFLLTDTFLLNLRLCSWIWRYMKNLKKPNATLKQKTPMTETSNVHQCATVIRSYDQFSSATSPTCMVKFYLNALFCCLISLPFRRMFCYVASSFLFSVIFMHACKWKLSTHRHTKMNIQQKREHNHKTCESG